MFNFIYPTCIVQIALTEFLSSLFKFWLLSTQLLNYLEFLLP